GYCGDATTRMHLRPATATKTGSARRSELGRFSRAPFRCNLHIRWDCSCVPVGRRSQSLTAPGHGCGEQGELTAWLCWHNKAQRLGLLEIDGDRTFRDYPHWPIGGRECTFLDIEFSCRNGPATSLAHSASPSKTTHGLMLVPES